MPEAAISGERDLTGPEKAAALLLTMGKPPAARLIAQFDPPDLQAVARAAAALGAIPASTLDRLVDEFAADFSAGADLLGDPARSGTCSPTRCPPSRSPTFSALRRAKPISPTSGGRCRKRRKARSLRS